MNPPNVVEPLFSLSLRHPEPQVMRTRTGAKYTVRFEVTHEDYKRMVDLAGNRGTLIECQVSSVDTANEKEESVSQPWRWSCRAALYGNNPDWLRYARVYCDRHKLAPWAYQFRGSNRADYVRAMIYHACQITSRATLDSSAWARELFLALEHDVVEWNETNAGD